MNEVVSSSAQYYSEIFCDPVDVDKVYILDTYSAITEDGGKTFHELAQKADTLMIMLFGSIQITQVIFSSAVMVAFMKLLMADRHSCSKIIYQ